MQGCYQIESAAGKSKPLRFAEKRFAKKALTMDDNVEKLANWRRVVWALQFAVAIAALTMMSPLASAQTDTETSRIQISFLKVAHGSGSGYLFYQNQKYALAIVAPEIKRIWATSIDLIGSVSNLRGASDIIGTYTAGDAGAATVRRAKTVRLENKKGAVLEVRAVNLNRWTTLNLSGMTIKNSGWQPSPE